MVVRYSFFRLNMSGVVDTAATLALADDATALAYARELGHPGPVEVWAGQRKVAIVPPQVDRRGADRRFPNAKTPGR